MDKLLILLFLTVLWCKINSQNDSLRNETHIFWSSDYRISVEDFHDTIKSLNNLDYCQKYNLCWGAYTGLFSVMDIPKKKRNKKSMHEAIYFAPAFEVTKSYRLTTDSLDFLKQVIVFDMYELAARKCRMELDSIYNTSPSIGIKGIFFKSVESENQKILGNIVRAYTQEVYIEKQEGAYEKWKKLIDEALDKTTLYQTTAIDRIRFINNEPILKEYIKSPTVIGNLFE